MQQHTVTIEKLSFGGAGFGHCNGKACFVPFTAPGDVVSIDVVADKKSFITAKMKKLTEPSPFRTEPPCPVFGECGGCHWQHIPYDVQLSEKQHIFTELLVRFASVRAELVQPILAAPSPFYYRARVQLKVHFAGGNVHVGFFRAGSHFVIDVPGQCAIAHPVINALIAQLQEFLSIFPEPGRIPQVDIATGDDGKSLVILHYIGGNLDRVLQFALQKRSLLGSVTSLWLQSGRKSTLTRVEGYDFLSYTVPTDSGASSVRLKFSSGAFSQVNLRQNLELINIVQEWARITGNERILDIYCGNGNFSIPLASRAAEVFGMEDYEPSVRDANDNCVANGIGNAVYTCADAASGVRRLIGEAKCFDIIILDPPRSGAKDVVGLLTHLRPKAVIYISCDPATLARDIGIMREGGLDVVMTRPVDMFPQTYHLESVTLLQPQI